MIYYIYNIYNGQEEVKQNERSKIFLCGRLSRKPKRFSPAHKNPNLAELVRSNFLRSAAIDSAVGLLKEEMRLAGCLIMDVAHKTQIPAGKAMAVDRKRSYFRAFCSIIRHYKKTFLDGN